MISIRIRCPWIVSRATRIRKLWPTLVCAVLLVARVTSTTGDGGPDSAVLATQGLKQVAADVWRPATTGGDAPIIPSGPRTDKPDGRAVTEDGDGATELSDLRQRKKFFGLFDLGLGKTDTEQSGESKFRSLHGKAYDPYDFDEHRRLYEDEYDDPGDQFGDKAPLLTKGDTTAEPMTQQEPTAGRIPAMLQNSGSVANQPTQSITDSGGNRDHLQKSSSPHSPELREERGPSGSPVPEDLKNSGPEDGAAERSPKLSGAPKQTSNQNWVNDDEKKEGRIRPGESAAEKQSQADKDAEQIGPNPVPSGEKGPTSDDDDQLSSSTTSALSDRRWEPPRDRAAESAQQERTKRRSRRVVGKGMPRNDQAVVEEPLMLEFAHNRPDTRILWLPDPDHWFTEERYRLIDADAERAFITAKDYGFVNADYDASAVERLISYIDNNKPGYETLNFQFTKEWNKKPLEIRVEVCECLVNDSVLMRKYGIVYDSSQPAEQIRAHHITIRLQAEGIGPRRYRALSCPAVHPQTSTVSTLFVAPVFYREKKAHKYVFVFIHDDRFKDPLSVRLMCLSRLVSGESTEAEYVDENHITDIDDLWWYGQFKKEN